MLALLQATTDLQAIARQTVQYIMPEVIVTIFACGALVLDVLLCVFAFFSGAWLVIAIVVPITIPFCCCYCCGEWWADHCRPDQS